MIQSKYIIDAHDIWTLKKEKFYNKERQLKFSYTWMTSLQIIDLFWRTIYERNYKYNV